MKVFESYQVTHPLGQTFRAVVLSEEGFPVLSNRNGTWQPDEYLTMADLAHPEYKLGEWDVTRDAIPFDPDAQG